MRDHKLVVDEIPTPEPGTGEILVRTLACGICGSDLHTLQHADRLAEAAVASGAPEGSQFDPARDVVLGHEFCAEVVSRGPNTTPRYNEGDRIVAMPLVFRGTSLQAVGFSNDVPGGYAEYMVLSEPMMMPVPEGLAPEHAALTEPLAVGIHAVAKARMQPGDAALVVGCGCVGLAVIAALRMAGVETIVASDFSSVRRAVAERLGARGVVDARERDAFEAMAETQRGGRLVVFENVGVPGMLQDIIRKAPRGTHVVVAGVCMEDDAIQPAIAINKELSFQFVLGWTPEEFARALKAIGDGELDCDALVTGRVGLDEVPGAFDALARPDGHAKIVVEPWRQEPWRPAAGRVDETVTDVDETVTDVDEAS